MKIGWIGTGGMGRQMAGGRNSTQALIKVLEAMNRQEDPGQLGPAL